MKDYLLFCGFFPKPISGNSFITNNIYNYLKKNNKKLIKLDFGNLDLNHNIFIQKLIKLINNFIFLIKLKKKFQIYYVINDGKKSIYDFFFILLVYAKGAKKIYLHHHSYKYINNKSFLKNVLFHIIKYRAQHIFLDNLQEKKFSRQYPLVSSIILSNCFVIQNNLRKFSFNKKLIKIGYFSFISKEKGIEIFFETIKYLKENNFKFKAFIAGDVDPKIKQWFKNEIFVYNKFCIYKKNCSSNYKKKVFFKDIDILLFPSIYNTEAYPISILESFSFGVPVIANNVGSISQMVNNKTGRLVKNIKRFKNMVKSELIHISKVKYLDKSVHCFNFIRKQKKISQQQLFKLKNFLDK